MQATLLYLSVAQQRTSTLTGKNLALFTRKLVLKLMQLVLFTKSNGKWLKTG